MLLLNFRRIFKVRKIIFIFSIILALGCGYWMGLNKNIMDNNVPSVEVVGTKSTSIPAILTPPKTDIENSIQSMNVLLEVEKSSSVSVASVADHTDQGQIDAIKIEYELKQRSELFTNWIIKNQEAKPWFDLGAEMRGQFNAEEVDYEWALAEEGRLRSVFTQEQELADIAVKSTTCRSTQCQIVVGVIDQAHTNEVAMVITRVLSGEKVSHIIVDSQAQQGESTFYISSNEKGFEFN